MGWFWPALTAAVVADSALLRSRVAAFDVLHPSDGPVAPHHRFLTARNVVVDEATARAASAHATRLGLDVARPRARRPAGRAAARPRPARRPRPLPRRRPGPGPRGRPGAPRHRGAGGPGRHRGPRRARPRRHGRPRRPHQELRPTHDGPRPRPRPVGGAVRQPGPARLAPGHDRGAVRHRRPRPRRRPAGRGGPQPPTLGAGRRRGAGAPAVAGGGRHRRPPARPGRRRAGRLVSSARDLPRALGRWVAGAGDERRRAEYDDLLAGGVDGFFDQRRPDCPLCGSRDLAVRLDDRRPAAVQAGHVHARAVRRLRPHLPEPAAQRRRASTSTTATSTTARPRARWAPRSAGSEPFYAARAEMLRPAGTPRRWLDVGTGHGHFCLMAREVWPDTTFDGLDMSETHRGGRAPRLGRHRLPRHVPRARRRAGRPVRRGQHVPLPRAHARPQGASSTRPPRCWRPAGTCSSRCPTPSRAWPTCSALTGRRGASPSTCTS